jgi:hypothetical protein
VALGLANVLACAWKAAHVAGGTNLVSLLAFERDGSDFGARGAAVLLPALLAREAADEGGLSLRTPTTQGTRLRRSAQQGRLPRAAAHHCRPADDKQLHM